MHRIALSASSEMPEFERKSASASCTAAADKLA